LAQQPVTLKHEGVATGENKTVDGITIYHAYPQVKSTDNAILFFTDIFGLALPQNRLLADSYAQAGYLVLLPDYFKGDPIPTDRTGFNNTAWRERHPESEVTAIIDATIKYARNQLGVKRLGAVGFCFGGPYVVRTLAAGKGVDVGFIAHPGAISKAEFEAITKPLTIAAAETDSSFNATKRHDTEDILAAKNATYQINLYSGASHGFAIRVDMSNRRQVFAKESAFRQALSWFDTWLKGASTGSKTLYTGTEWVSQEGIGRDQRVAHDFEYSS